MNWAEQVDQEFGSESQEDTSEMSQGTRDHRLPPAQATVELEVVVPILANTEASSQALDLAMEAWWKASL